MNKLRGKLLEVKQQPIMTCSTAPKQTDVNPPTSITSSTAPVRTEVNPQPSTSRLNPIEFHYSLRLDHPGLNMFHIRLNFLERYYLTSTQIQQIVTLIIPPETQTTIWAVTQHLP